MQAGPFARGTCGLGLRFDKFQKIRIDFVAHRLGHAVRAPSFFAVQPYFGNSRSVQVDNSKIDGHYLYVACYDSLHFADLSQALIDMQSA
jgi:hypothetical protein